MPIPTHPRLRFPELLRQHKLRLKTEFHDGRPRRVSGHFFCEVCGKPFPPGSPEAQFDECPGSAEEILI